MSEEIKKNNYSADSIQALEGMEHVRMRPSMYIGDTGVRGLHHLVYEVVDNSIDEALAGHCDTITVAINEDNSFLLKIMVVVFRLICTKKKVFLLLEVVMTKIGAGGKFDKDSYKVSGGLHGVGVSCVNALSDHLRATVLEMVKLYEQEYERGKAMYPVKQIGKLPKEEQWLHSNQTTYFYSNY
jgi:DNA gyrase subunit B